MSKTVIALGGIPNKMQAGDMGLDGRNQDPKHLNLLVVFHVVILVLGLFSSQAGDFQWLRTAGGSGAEQAAEKFV